MSLPKQPDWRIVVDAEGIERRHLALPERTWKIRWTRLKEVGAWKDDVWGYDIICLGFRVQDEPEYLWCEEESEGWDDLIKIVERTFQNPHMENWWSRVAFPAFERNWTTLWGTPWPKNCATCGYDLRASKERCPECGTPMPPAPGLDHPKR